MKEGVQTVHGALEMLKNCGVTNLSGIKQMRKCNDALQKLIIVTSALTKWLYEK